MARLPGKLKWLDVGCGTGADDIRGTVDGKPWSIRENLENSLKY